MKIGLDFDGVFCDVEQLLNDGARKMFGNDRRIKPFRHLEILQSEDFSRKELDKLKKFVFDDTNSDLELKPILGVELACCSLFNYGHQLQIVTKRNSGVAVANEFCKRWGINIPIIGLKPNQPKSSVLSDFDLFLDDSVDVLDELKNKIPNRFLFSSDVDERLPTEIIRVSSWLDFVKQIN